MTKPYLYVVYGQFENQNEWIERLTTSDERMAHCHAKWGVSEEAEDFHKMKVVEFKKKNKTVYIREG